MFIANNPFKANCLAFTVGLAETRLQLSHLEGAQTVENRKTHNMIDSHMAAECQSMPAATRPFGTCQNRGAPQMELCLWFHFGVPSEKHSQPFGQMGSLSSGPLTFAWRMLCFERSWS